MASKIQFLNPFNTQHIFVSKQLHYCMASKYNYNGKKWLFVSYCCKQHKAFWGLEQVLVLSCLIRARYAGLNFVDSAGKLFGQTPICEDSD